VIERCASVDQAGWLALREALWPDTPRPDHLAEMASFLQDASRFAQFVAYDAAGEAVGFVEVSLRRDHVVGTRSSPVAYLEGIFVVPRHRRRGAAKDLLGAVARWAREQGCTELASDALLDNELSHAVHRALGFEETERAVFFRKDLARGNR
jgi:aminoglycoside 6'-N-acetyltransferase I